MVMGRQRELFLNWWKNALFTVIYMIQRFFFLLYSQELMNEGDTVQTQAPSHTH
jgi:hypothetical protein